jgi:hypothetical protein
VPQELTGKKLRIIGEMDLGPIRTTSKAVNIN